MFISLYLSGHLPAAVLSDELWFLIISLFYSQVDEQWVYDGLGVVSHVIAIADDER